MKSSFSRNFCTAATILLMALTILGASFQIQINNFLENTTVSRLTQDSEVVANLAGAYGIDGNLDSRELMLNLDVVSQITNADIVICDNEGYIVLCTGDLGRSDHDGWQLNQDFLEKVYQNSSFSEEQLQVIREADRMGIPFERLVQICSPDIPAENMKLKLDYSKR